jgi:hypothetical protein
MSAKTPDEVFNKFLERVACGEAVSQVCRDPSMPAWVTISRKIAADPSFEQQYRLALEFRGMVLADELDEIKQEARTAPKERAAGLRVAADILKWQSGRMTPKLYGDRQQVDVQKVEGGSYLELLTKVNDVAKSKLIESTEDTQLDKVRARATEVNQILVNNDMPKKQANRKKKDKKLSTGS